MVEVYGGETDEAIAAGLHAYVADCLKKRKPGSPLEHIIAPDEPTLDDLADFTLLPKDRQRMLSAIREGDGRCYCMFNITTRSGGSSAYGSNRLSTFMEGLSASGTVQNEWAIGATTSGGPLNLWVSQEDYGRIRERFPVPTVGPAVWATGHGGAG